MCVHFAALCLLVLWLSLSSAHFLFELVVSSRPRTMTALRMHAHAHVMTERSHTRATCAHVLPSRLQVVLWL